MANYVIVLNWNGWRDTIECLESVFRLDCKDFRVIVCDNASTDGSLERLKEWASGELQFGELRSGAANPELCHLSNPPVLKPIPNIQLTREEAESAEKASSAPLVLIETGANLGYAGGNNVGLRYALRDATAEFFWLLNNDTVVDSDALTEMILLMQQHPKVGLCGSLNLSYFEPKKTLVRGGGRYNRWTARVSKYLAPEGSQQAPARLDFITGASVLASRAFLTAVGLMEESYFLYFEEHDWAIRAKGKFDLGFASKSVIYHKEGRSIGSHRNREMRSLLSERYLSRNRILFTRRFFPWALPSVMTVVAVTAGYWLMRGKLERARAMLSSMCKGLEYTAETARAAR